MGHTFSLFPDRRIAVMHFDGDFELEPTLNAPLELFAREDFEPSFGVIVDLRDRTDDLPDLDEATALARNLIRFRSLFEGPIALVVREGPHRRQAQLTAGMTSLGGLPAQIFTNLAEAEAWIASRVLPPQPAEGPESRDAPGKP